MARQPEMLPVTADAGKVLEQVVILGDLSKMSPTDRVKYYAEVCKSLGLNPLTKPFQYIQLNGKLTLYATRDCTDQLRKNNQISIQIVSRERIDDLLIVTARASIPSGRCDESIGAVSVAGLKGENLANAMMKCETKAKRRVTLSLSGLGWTDESEVDSIPGAKAVPVNIETGEIEQTAAQEQRQTTQPTLIDLYGAAEKVGVSKEAVDKMIVTSSKLKVKDPGDLKPAQIAQLLQYIATHPADFQAAVAEANIMESEAQTA